MLTYNLDQEMILGISYLIWAHPWVITGGWLPNRDASIEHWVGWGLSRRGEIPRTIRKCLAVLLTGPKEQILLVASSMFQVELRDVHLWWGCSGRTTDQNIPYCCSGKTTDQKILYRQHWQILDWWRMISHLFIIYEKWTSYYWMFAHLW